MTVEDARKTLVETGVTAFVPRHWPSLAEWREMSVEERRASTDHRSPREATSCLSFSGGIFERASVFEARESRSLAMPATLSRAPLVRSRP